MVNRREKAVAERYESRGWTAIRGGWPDWLMVQTDGENVTDCKCVEVKSPSGSLRYNQSIVRVVLEDQLGANYTVEVVE
jgi:hypothetical protein